MVFFQSSAAALLMLVMVFQSLPCQANILIFQSSDNHSEYGNIPGYIRSTSAQARAFAERHPGHPVIHLANGDVTGPSIYTLLHGGDDNGFLNYEVFAELNHHYLTIVNSGNHEAFDYNGVSPGFGHALFLEQGERFLSLANHDSGHAPIRLITANLELTDASRHLFQPYQDVISPSSKKIRFVGLLLDEFYKYSVYDDKAQPQVLTGVRSMQAVAREQLLAAAEDGAHAVVFFFHEQFNTVKTEITDLLLWKQAQEATNPALALVRIPVVFAAHDHKPNTGKVLETTLIDSGAAYTFSEIELDDDGNLVQQRLWTNEQQKKHENYGDLLPREAAVLNHVTSYLQEAETQGRAPVLDALGQPYISPGYAETRTHLRTLGLARTKLGNSLADTLVSWATHELRTLTLPRAGESAPASAAHSPHSEGAPATDSLLNDVAGVLSFFNSGTYRVEAPFPAGPITRKMAISPYPFPGPGQIYLLSGAHIQEMYQSLRDYGISRHEHTPQLPSHLRERTHDSSHTLEVLHPDGAWLPLNPSATYALALDKWLGENGFGVPAFDRAFAQGERLKPGLSELNEIFMRYFPTHAAGCEGALGGV